MTSQLEEANKLIEELRKGTGDDKALQDKIADYEAFKLKETERITLP